MPEEIYILSNSSVGARFDLQVALSELKMKSQPWKVIKVVCFFLTSPEKVGFWQVWFKFETKCNKVGEGCSL